MNIIEKSLAKIPFNEVIIKTTIPAKAIIERIDYGVKPFFNRRQQGQFFTFDGSYEENYFKIQGHLRNPNGEDAFPNKVSIRIAFVRLPLRIETSPTFYGRVFDDENNGATIKGHFGIPFPTFALVCVLVVLLIAKIYPRFSEISLFFSIFLLIWSVTSIIEFITERKGIIDFLKGLFHDVIKTE